MLKEVLKDNFSIENHDDMLNNIKDDFINNPYGKLIVYEEETIIGYLYYSLIYDRIEINQIEVKEKFRNLKIASKLMEYLVNLNSSNITLEVRIDNIPAIKLYEKYNFKNVAIRKNYYKDCDGILMIRE